MATKNPDGTVVVRTAGALFRYPKGNGLGRVVQPAYNGFNGGGGGLVFTGANGNRRAGWRVVSTTER